MASKIPSAYDDGGFSVSLPSGPVRPSPPVEERPPVREALSAGDILQATPPQPSAHSVLSGSQGIEWQRHHRWVKKYFRDKIVWDVNPEKFIQAVWSFADEDLPETPFRARGGRIADPPSYAPQKNAIINWIKAKQETKSYEPLAGIANSLLHRVYGPISSQERLREYPAQFKVRNVQYEGGYTQEKVDMSFSTVDTTAGERPKWDFEAAFMEVKKTKVAPLPSLLGGLRANNTDGDRVSHTGKRKRSTIAGEGGGLPKAKRSRTPDRDAEEAQADPADEDKGESDHDGLSVQQQEHDLTNNEAQAVRYMNNLMSSNVRSFGIGWLVEDNNMRLWYGDRMGIVVTRKFRFLHGDHRLFLRCIAAMGQSSVHGMGIFPDLHLPGNSPSGPPQLKQYKGAQLRITAKRPDASEPENFEFDVDEQAGRIYTEFGALGRGTSVIPIKARSDTSKHFQNERLVAKVSWPHALRKAEDSLIIAVRKGLAEAKPQYLQHIVDLKCSVTRTIEELGLPRVALGLYQDDIDLRVCRTLVMKSYERLEVVESVEHFKTVYVDVVRAHYWVWTTTRTLHRDISTNNIMWFRDRDGKVIGVLCDWDLAEQNMNGDIPPTVTDERPAPENPPAVALGAQSGSAAVQADAKLRSSNALKPRYRTGTGPFMALDLLRQGTPPAHLYRHDLESFLYLLAYVCAVWDPENKRFGRMHAWERETLTEIWANKHGFLKQREVYDEVFKHAHPSLKHLTEYGSETSWIPTLAAVFSLIEAHTSTIQALQSVQSSFRRGPPAAALEARIKKEEADRENEISYEIFMEILGASLDI